VTRLVYHLAVALAIIILQTTVISRLSVMERFYDPALIMLAYLALFIPFWHGLGLAVLMGAAMDQVSASPFGLYFFVYLWLFLLVYWSALFLHTKNILVLSLLVAAMVIGEHLLLGRWTTGAAAKAAAGYGCPHSLHCEVCQHVGLTPPICGTDPSDKGTST